MMPKAEQAELPGTKVEAPKSVRGKHMLVKYVRPHYESDKDERSVSLEFSMPLTADHEKLLSEEVLYFWKIIKKAKAKTISGIEVKPVCVNIYLAPDDKPEVSLLCAKVYNASLTKIEETGSGAAQNVIRFSFRLNHPINDTLCEFADQQFDKQLWLTMDPVQASLLKEMEAAEKD